MAKTVSTSVKLPAKLDKELCLQVIKDGYGMRGKNKWVNDAIEEFLKLPAYIDYTDIASDMTELSKAIGLRISKELIGKVDKAVIEIRKVNFEIEAIQSHIIRAAIMQKIIRSPNK
jgi:hypothetical protein